MFASGKDTLAITVHVRTRGAGLPGCTHFLDALDGGLVHRSADQPGGRHKNPVPRIAAFARAGAGASCVWYPRLATAMTVTILVTQRACRRPSAYSRSLGRVRNGTCRCSTYSAATARRSVILGFGSPLRTARAGQEYRHNDALDPLWNMLDLTPEGAATFIEAELRLAKQGTQSGRDHFRFWHISDMPRLPDESGFGDKAEVGFRARQGAASGASGRSFDRIDGLKRFLTTTPNRCVFAVLVSARGCRPARERIVRQRQCRIGEPEAMPGVILDRCPSPLSSMSRQTPRTQLPSGRENRSTRRSCSGPTLTKHSMIYRCAATCEFCVLLRRGCVRRVRPLKLIFPEYL